MKKTQANAYYYLNYKEIYMQRGNGKVPKYYVKEYHIGTS